MVAHTHVSVEWEPDPELASTGTSSLPLLRSGEPQEASRKVGSIILRKTVIFVRCEYVCMGTVRAFESLISGI